MADAPKRIQRRRSKGWRMPEGAVYVGRGSEFGNRYRAVLGDGGRWHVVNQSFRLRKIVMQGLTSAAARVHAVALYRVLLQQKEQLARRVRRELRGRDLACWCAPGAPCHGDVLIELANGPSF